MSTYVSLLHSAYPFFYYLISMYICMYLQKQSLNLHSILSELCWKYRRESWFSHKQPCFGLREPWFALLANQRYTCNLKNESVQIPYLAVVFFAECQHQLNHDSLCFIYSPVPRNGGHSYMYNYRMSVISFIEVISIHHLQLEIQENVHVFLDARLL